MEVEELEAAHARRAERRLDVLLVEERLQLPRRVEEVGGLVRHPARRQRVREDVEVLRLQVAGVLRPLGEVRVGAPLADLVADHGHGARLHVVAVVRPRLRRFRVDARREPLAPGLDARVGGHVELVLGDLRPARGARVEPARVERLPVLDPPAQELRVPPGGLVSVGQEEEGRVVAVGLQDARRLAVEPLVDRQARAEARRVVRPGSDLHLVVEALLVRGGEGRLRRAPRVEADRVQAVRLRDADDALPGRDVGRRVAGLREDRALEGAAQEGLAAVHDELGALRPDLPQAEADRPRVPGHARLESRGQLVKHRRELVPGGSTRAERQLDLEGTARRVPGHLRGLRLERRASRRPRFEPQGPAPRGACRVADAAPRDRRPGRDAREDLQVLDPHGRRGPQFHPAHDPVPVGLRVVGDAVRVEADVHDEAVVHA